MKSLVGVVAVLGLALGGCQHGAVLDVAGMRELRPPQAGIFVGGLYYADPVERPKSGQGPLTLHSLCKVSRDLVEFGVPAPSVDPNTVSNIDLLQIVRRSGELRGLDAELARIDISASFSDLYEYKIVNVTKYYVDSEIADPVFDGLMKRKTCRMAYNSRSGVKEIHQVIEVYYGDIVFTRKTERSLSADALARLRGIEPTLKARLDNSLSLGFSGKGLVFGVVTEQRNQAAAGRGS